MMNAKSLVLIAITVALLILAQPASAIVSLPGNCNMGECWDQQFISKTLIRETPQGRLYSVQIAVRRWDQDVNPPDRFNPPKTSYVFCSTTKPAYIFSPDDGSAPYYAHLLNPGGEWFGYNQGDYPVYWVTCHNFVGPDFFSGEMRARATQLGYPLSLPTDQIELNNYLDILN